MTPLLQVLAGDPLRTPGDALVRPVTMELEGITPWAREAEVLGGAQLRDRISTLDALPAGAVLVTPAGDLPFQLLLHVVLLAPGEDLGAALLLRGLRHALRQAREWEVEALVLPLLGAGPGQLDVETASEVLADALAEHLPIPLALRVPLSDPGQVPIVSGILGRGLPGVPVEVVDEGGRPGGRP